jgi:trimethylamine--corrinoid protein Co-methyltransferase
MVRHYLKGVDVTDETIMLEVIEEIGIGGNFLEHPSTAEHAHDVYWRPSIFNRKRFSEWVRDGEKSALDRAHERVKQILAQPEKSILTDDQVGAMDDIIGEARAKLCECVQE